MSAKQEKLLHQTKDHIQGLRTKIKNIPWRQVLVAFVVSLGQGGFGYNNAWSSYTLPSLTGCEDNPQKPDGCTFDNEFSEEEGSWIVSTLTLGQIFSLPIAGVFMKISHSRRFLMLGMTVIYLVGWTILSLTEPLDLEEIHWFYISRFIIGLGSGSYGMAGVLYVHESVEPSIRGALGNIPTLLLVSAYFFGTLFGAITEWYIVTYIGYVWPVSLLVGLLFIPETPFSLVYTGKVDEARESIAWLNKDIDVDAEIHRLEEAQDELKAMGKVSILGLFTSSVYLKPLLVLLGVHFLVYFTGLTGVSLYMTDIFIKAGFDADKSLYYSAAVATAQVLGTVTSILVIDKMGRKPVLIASSTGLLLTMTALATFFYLDDHVAITCPHSETTNTTSVPCIQQDGFDQETVESLAWLPLTSLFIYKYCHAFGLTPLSFNLAGEFFSSEAKDASNTVAFLFANACSFVITKYQVNIENAFGTAGLYYFYASFALVSIFYCLLIVPETKGKTAKEMKRMYSKPDLFKKS